MTNVIKKIYSGPVFDLQQEQVDLPNGVSCELDIIHHPGGVAVVAINEREEICLLRQYRHAAGSWIWEIPAGKIEPDEAHALTAKRELVEEVGVDASDWTYLGKTLCSPGILTEIIRLYLAKSLLPAQQELEAAEVIEVHWFSLDQIRSMVKAGDIIDAKTLVALYYLQNNIEA